MVQLLFQPNLLSDFLVRVLLLPPQRAGLESPPELIALRFAG
jgi:hypothetical protein